MVRSFITTRFLCAIRKASSPRKPAAGSTKSKSAPFVKRRNADELKPAGYSFFGPYFAGMTNDQALMTKEIPIANSQPIRALFKKVVFNASFFAHWEIRSLFGRRLI